MSDLFGYGFQLAQWSLAGKTRSGPLRVTLLSEAGPRMQARFSLNSLMLDLKI